MAPHPWTSVLQVGRIVTNITNRNSLVPAKWRAQLSQPATLYGMSPVAYTLLGLHELTQAACCPRSLPGESTAILPVRTEAILLIAQGVWSFMSDVRNIGRPSLFHCIDRFSAVCLFGVQLLKFSTAALPLWELLFVWCSLAVGFYCKVMSSRAIVAGSASSYAHWHLCWHWSLPFLMLSYHLYRWHAFWSQVACT